MAVWEFNKGEWTEAYVFMRLLGDGRIYGASSNLTRDPSTYIDIIKIILDEPDRILIFERFIDSNISYIKATKDKVVLKVATAPEFSEYAQELYNSIRTIRTQNNKKFSELNVQDFLEAWGLNSPKANLSQSAKERYGTKTDIILTSEDSLDHTTTTEGFSIKSHLGSSSTLFNASQTSGFKYKIIGCDNASMQKLNSKDSFRSIIDSIKEKYSLEYAGCRNDCFKQNIEIVDTRMEEILSNAVLVCSGYYESPVTNNVKDICDRVVEHNPIKVGRPSVLYPAKFKDFLFASFAGMTASSPWNGRKLLTGGYIDVKLNGEMLYYRALSDDIFSNYLFNNTFFDLPDRGVYKDLAVAEAKAYLSNKKFTESDYNSIIYVNGIGGRRKSKKGNYGYVYCADNQYYIDINFQIRFR